MVWVGLERGGLEVLLVHKGHATALSPAGGQHFYGALSRICEGLNIKKTNKQTNIFQNISRRLVGAVIPFYC